MKKKKENYESPMMEELAIVCEDILAASPGGDENEGEWDPLVDEGEHVMR